MISFNSKLENRYINDLRRLEYSQGTIRQQKTLFILLGIALIFLILIAVFVGNFVEIGNEQTFILIAAAMVGGYMALNIGANDVANNMGPAVGGKVISVGVACIGPSVKK